jgi:two-component system cell cycle sensor histidine kinase/response regulator CckA
MDYQRFFEFTPAASYIATPDGVIVGCNPAFLRLFGFRSVEEAQAHGMASLYLDQQTLADFVKRLGVPPVYADQELRRVDGSHLHALAGAVGIFDQQQQLVQITGFFLEESQLRASRQGLYEALRIEALERLAGNIAVNFDDLLWIAGDRLPASDSGLLLARMRETVRSASLLRQRLLAFSRMQMLQPAPLHLNTLLTRLGAMISRTLSTEIEIVFDLARDLGATMVDQVQLEQIILELVENARDAMPLSGRMVFKTENVTITRNSACQSAHDDLVPPGDYTLLSVGDNGIGMDDPTRERAFEPFFGTKWLGRGLGLSAVHGIVKQSRGFIHIESAPDEGTTFLIYLPRTEQEVSCRVTLLIVEGDEFLRRQMREHFKRCGYAVLVASNGLEACKVAAGHEGQIDVLVTELVMQHMIGPELAQRLLMVRPSLQIVFLSPTVGPHVGNLVEHLRANVVAKPLLLSALAATISALLGPREASKPSSLINETGGTNV